MIDRFEEINHNYRTYQWAWTYKMIQNYYGVDEITAEVDAKIKADYITARRAWIAEIKKDAEKEYKMGDVDREVFEEFVNSLDRETDYEE